MREISFYPLDATYSNTRVFLPVICVCTYTEKGSKLKLLCFPLPLCNFHLSTPFLHVFWSEFQGAKILTVFLIIFRWCYYNIICYSPLCIFCASHLDIFYFCTYFMPPRWAPGFAWGSCSWDDHEFIGETLVEVPWGRGQLLHRWVQAQGHARECSNSNCQWHKSNDHHLWSQW